MRYIKTENYQIEFIEANDEGKVLNSIGLQLGEVYFQIKNKKVAFYLNDSEKPFDNFIWSMNLPITIDGETYEDEDEASAALSKLMVLEDLNEIKERLDAEILRSTNEDTKHDAEISALTEDLEDEIERSTAEDERLEQKLDDEITRSTAKDAEHDTLISGLTDDLEDIEDKVDEAISAHTRLEQKIDDEISRAYSAETLINQALANEVARAVSAETRIEIKLDQEIQDRIDGDAALSGAIDSLSAYCEDTYAKKTDLESEIDARTAKDEELEDKIDNAVSGLTDALNAEIERATAREDDIAEDLDDEFHRAQTAEHLLEDKIVTERERALDAEERLEQMIISGGTGSGVTSGQVQTMIDNSISGKADIDDVYTKSQTDEAIADAIDDIDLSNYYTKSEVDASQLAQDNKINTISGKVDTISANTYTKSEVDNIVNNIESGITQDLSNYYTKSEVDASQAAQDAKINTISGDVQTLSGKVDTISGDVITLGGDVQTLSGEVQTISGSAITSGDAQTMIDNSISGKQDTLIAGSGITIDSNNKIDCTVKSGDLVKAGRDISITSGYFKTINLDLPLSGATDIYNFKNKLIGNDYANEAKNSFESAFGYLNISRKNSSVFYDSDNTLFTIGNGNIYGNKHNAFEVRATGEIYIVDTSSTSDYDSKPMILLQDALATAAGSGVTSGQVQTMIDNSLSGYQETLSAGTNVQINNNVISATDTKYTAGDGISISNQNVISTVTKFWCGTQAQYDAITIKDPNTVYMIHE